MISVKKRRLQKGMTQAKLAEAVGVSQGSVALWEAGEITPRIPTLRKLADLFGCTIDDLLRETQEGAEK